MNTSTIPLKLHVSGAKGDFCAGILIGEINITRTKRVLGIGNMFVSLLAYFSMNEGSRFGHHQPAHQRNERQTEQVAQPKPWESHERDVFEALLVKHAERLNEGHNGIIFGLRVHELEDEEYRLLQGRGILGQEEDPERVMKILKMGSPQSMQKEYTLAQKAHRVITEKRKQDAAAYADVPAPRYFDVFPASPAFRREFLDANAISVSEEGLELMVMDRVDGVDMDTLLLSEFLERNPNSPVRGNREKISHFSYADLEDLAARSLGYRLDLRGRRGDWDQKTWTVYTRFRGELEQFLRQDGFRIDNRILDSIERSAKAVHQDAGVIWGDGNWRNIMLEGSHEDANDGKSWLIDFGGSEDEDLAERPDELKRQAIEAIRKLKALFGNEVTTREQRQDKATAAEVRERTRVTRGGRAVERLVGPLESKLDAQDILPFMTVMQQLNRGLDWVEFLSPVLYRLASRDAASRERVAASIRAWLQDPENTQVALNARVQSELTRVYRLIQEMGA
jgi:hypothetical protein